MEYPYRKQIGELVNRGINPSDNLLGVHGTNLESVLRLASTGIFPSGIVDGEYTFFVPREFCFKKVKDRYAENPELDRRFDVAVDYAQINARVAWIARELGFDSSLYGTLWKADSMITQRDEDEDQEFFNLISEITKKTNSDSRKVMNLIKHSKRIKLKGVVIGFSNKIKECFKTGVFLNEVLRTDLQYERNYSCIETPSGILIDFISGIEPLGDYEWSVLENFQD